MISAQNVTLAHLGSDLRQHDLGGRVEVPSITSDRTGGVPLDADRERELIELSRHQRMKPTCAPDDGSNAGPWVYVPASDVDGGHRYTRANSGVDLTQFERETDNV